MLDVIKTAKIEACVNLATGKTPALKAKDFKAKVIATTGLTSEEFDTTHLTSTVYGQIAQGEPINEILTGFF